MKGSLQAALLRRKCQSETPPAGMTEEGMMVDGEKYDIVYSFCYLGNMSSMKGGTPATVLAWNTFRELAPFLTYETPLNVKGQVCMTCIRSSLLGTSREGVA